MPFTSYAAAGFTSELLPILPPDAPINPGSPSHDELLLSRGKVPGKRSRDGWFGFANWSVHEASTKDCENWSKWRSGIGMQGRKYPAVDIDVDDGGLADAVEAEALFALGLAPARSGRAGRRLLVYHGAGIKKRRLAFRLRGGDAQPAGGHAGGPDEGQAPGRDGDALDPRGAEAEHVFVVEVLGDGQQYVVEGIHPKTGKPYAWRDGVSPAELGPAGLTPITAEEVDVFLENIRWMIEEIYDGEIVRFEQGAGGADRSGVWQEGLLAPSLAAVEEALAAIDNDLDYDDWFKLAVAVKAATGAAPEGFALFADWSATSGKDTAETTENKYASIRAPYSVGWDFLSRFAAAKGGFSSAEHEFEPVVGSSATMSDASPPSTPDSMDNMFERYAWVESAKRVVDLVAGDLLDQEQFEFRVPPMVKVTAAEDDDAKPTKTKLSPWKVFKENPKHRKSYKNLTCRFGMGRVVHENLPDLEGPCLNIWREPKLEHPLPDAATDAGISVFLRLAAHVVPNAIEREHVFDFMAHTAQRPNEKINHALVLGSRVEGIGKDTLLEPLRAAVGRRYVREIGPQQLTASFNRWLVGCKLLVVQEMHNFERRATMNLLKPLVASPPDALPVNLKGVQEFFVPNLLSTVFFTNESDALAISNGDRRYFITWNDGEPQPKAFYDEVWTWLRQGGTEQVIRWLLSRDISAFNAKGRAPETGAKETMRQETRAPLQAWLEDSIQDGDFPFGADLGLIEDVVRAAPEYARYRGQAIGPDKIVAALKKTSAKRVSGKVRIPGVDGSRAIWAWRRAEMYADQPDEVVRALFIKQRDEAQALGLKEAFR